MEKSSKIPQSPQPQAENARGPVIEQGTVSAFRDLRQPPPRVELASHGGLDVRAAVTRHPLLAFLVFAGFSLAGARYVMKHVPREYHAEASVYVSPTYFKNLQQDREQLQISYTTLVNQQILTIRRYDILREALKRLQKQGIQWRKAGESEEAAVERLAGALEIKYIPDSYEVTVGLNGKTPEQLAPILNTVTDTYVETEKQEEMSDHTSRLEALAAEQNTVAITLQQKLDQQAQFAQKLTTLSPDKASSEDYELLTGARQALEDAHRKRVEAEAQLTILQAKDGSGKNLLSTLAEEAATSDPNARPILDSLLQRSADLQKSTQGMTADHPLRQAADKELVEIQRQKSQLQTNLSVEASDRLLAKSRADVERSKLLEKELSQEVADYTARVQGVAKEVQLAQGVNDEVDRLRKQQGLITSEIDALNMPADSAGFLRIFSAARMPLEPTKSNSNKLLFAVLVGALMMGMGTSVGLDMADQRILAPSEVERAVGFPPLGIVLERTPGTLAFAEEHFRRLVNGLQRGMSAMGAKNIVLTPVRHPRIPSTLITDIGRILVARGLKTAIVDANPCRPDEGRINATSRNGTGFLALTDPHPPEPSGAPDPRLPSRIEMAATKESSPAPLISRISLLLEELKQEYDVVLIDAPPLEFSADTEFLASIGDITLLVVESGEATRRELTRNASILGTVGARSVGVILSQVCLNQAGSSLKRKFKRFQSLPWSQSQA
jgi:capsular polysaccharide biosynthesis protein